MIEREEFKKYLLCTVGYMPGWRITEFYEYYGHNSIEKLESTTKQDEMWEKITSGKTCESCRSDMDHIHDYTHDCDPDTCYMCS